MICSRPELLTSKLHMEARVAMLEAGQVFLPRAAAWLGQ
jgi:hypothetical protein